MKPSNDACEHFANWPPDTPWLVDLVCGDIDFAAKMGLGKVSEMSLFERLIERYGSGEAVRAMVAAQESVPDFHVIPLPAGAWLLLGALGLLALLRRTAQ